MKLKHEITYEVDLNKATSQMDLTSGSGERMATSRWFGKISRLRKVSIGLPFNIWSLFLGDLALICLADVLSIWIRRGTPIDNILVYAIATAITLASYSMAFYIFDLYNIRRTFDTWETVYRTALAVLLGGVLAIFFFYLVHKGRFGRGIMAIQMLLTWSLLFSWRLAFGSVFLNSVSKIPVLILGAGTCGKMIYELLKSPFSPYEVKGFLDDDPIKLHKTMSPPVVGTSDELKEVAAQIGANTAILAIRRKCSSEFIRNVMRARLQGIEIKDMASVYEQLTGRIPVQSIGDQWLLFAEGFYLIHKEYMQKIKRLLDFLIACVFLFVSIPLFALVAIAVRLDSPGPLFYKQRRVGKAQKIFTIYKFRSMSDNAEVAGPVWASEKDPRVTTVGRFLRFTHIDELPQMWNVFNGDMSLVGPRPERPEFVQMLEKEIPYYFTRHSVRPGITGWAQVCYHYGASVDDAKNKLECDLYYVKNMSFFLDLKILLRTIGVVLLGEGSR